MSILRFFSFGCVATAVLTSCLPTAAHAAEDGESGCQQERVARVPLRNDAGFLNTPVQINGYAASMIVDTGSEGSLISPEGAAQINLPLDPSMHTMVRGTGGIGRLVPNVLVRSFKIGGLENGPLSIPVGSLPGKPQTQPPIEGLVGGDMLSRYDVEFDVAGHTLTFWRPARNGAGCAGPQGWHVIYRALPMQFDGRRVTIQVELDGHPMKALVDSGARSRIVSEAAVARLGVSEATLAADPGGITSGVDGHRQMYHWHKFHTLKYGLEEEKAPVLTVAPIQDSVDMLLGSDWFAAHKIWISYRTGKLYVMPSLKR